MADVRQQVVNATGPHVILKSPIKGSYFVCSVRLCCG